MSLKVRLWLYVGVLHAVLAATLIWQRESLGWWLFPLEIALAVSFVYGLRLARVAVEPLGLARRLAEVIESGEHGARYPSIGYAELDRVIGTYNTMLENLQREWLRLGEQRGFLERFLKVTPVGVAILDFDGRVSLANPRARELLGGPHCDALTGRTLAEIGSAVAGALDRLDVDEARMITDAAGRRLRCQRGEFEDRGFPRTYVLIEELTAEIHRTERAAYEKLIRMISHEVTNAVAATNSLLESCLKYAELIDGGEHRADYENALNVLIKRNRSLNEFTKGFSDLVKLPGPQREDVDLRNLLQAAQTMFSAELKARNITLRIAADANLPLVSMDRSQIDQVLMNVIMNAAEAIERDGTIEIVARRADGYVTLVVSDTGCGLNDQVRRNLFSPFFTTKRHGQGLGLMLVKEILTQHGFAFALEPGERGARFRIEIPLDSARIPQFIRTAPSTAPRRRLSSTAPTRAAD